MKFHQEQAQNILDLTQAIGIRDIALNTVSAEQLQQLTQLLCKDELEQMNRLRMLPDKKRFIIARASLRSILSKYLNLPPLDICFDKNDYDKPILTSAAQRNIHFNISHSGNHVVLAVTEIAPVGIDIEHMERTIEQLEIAKRFFHKSEYEYLQHCPAHKLNKDFFHIWTCKEAVIKALGYGLTYGLDTFSVQPDSDYESKLITIADANKFYLRSWDIDANHRAAICVLATKQYSELEIVHLNANPSL
jgi:4'-phosphopantetheinyl transferase